MKKNTKIILGVIIPLVVIGASIGGIMLYNFLQKRAIAKLEPPIIDFPVENTDTIDIIWGYGDQGGDFHNGIDFGCNSSVSILAWCDMTVVDVTTFLNDRNGLWQTNVFLEFNKRFTFDCAFEPGSQNETYANLQRDAINVEVGQTIQRGEVLGELLIHRGGTHIHFGMHDQGESVCAYHYFSETAKAIFNPLWIKYGFGDDSWYDDP